jgi:hypothetical protein
MHTKVVAVIAIACVNLIADPVFAQAQGRSVNPEGVEFDLSSMSQEDVNGYRVELFVAGADVRRELPVKSLELARGAVRDRGKIRVDLRNALMDLQDGEYVATIRPLTADRSIQSEPSEVFVVSRNQSGEDGLTPDRRERFWTKVAVSIGAGLLLLPIILR